MIERIASFAVLALVAASPAAAQTPDKTFDEWALHCEKSCALVQSVADEGHPEISLTVIALKAGATPILRIVTPLGVMLPTGVGLKIDEADLGNVGFLRCTTDGCIAEAELSPDQVAKLSTGATATFSLMQTPASGVAMPVSLKGFKDGFAALR